MIKKLSFCVLSIFAITKLLADPINVLYPQQFVCHGDCVEFVPEIISLKEPARFLWVTGDTTSSIIVCPDFGNSYKVTITDADGQTAIISAIVSVANDHLLPQPSIIGPVCSGDRLKFTHPNYGFIGTYHWFGPNQFVSTQREFIVEDAQTIHSGRYGMYINYYDKCPTDTVYMDVYVSPDKKYFQEVDSINACNTFCNLTQMELVKVKLPSQNSTGRQPQFLDSNNSKPPSNIIWTSFVAQDGNYTMYIRANACQDLSNEPGAIVGIFSDKNFQHLVISSDTCMKGVLNVASSLLEPGKTYYVFADGCGGNICDITTYMYGVTIPNYCSDYVPMSMITSRKYTTSNFGFSSEFWLTNQGDTTIFGKVYKKISGYPESPNNIPVFIREDIKNRRVYQYKPGFGELLLYNFNLKVGDSFILPTTNISFDVFMVDSISSHLGILKRWFFAKPGFGGFVYTECLGGNQLEFYRSVMVSDPVYGLSCAFSDCKPVILHQSCASPEPHTLRDTIQRTICAGENFMGYDSTGVYEVTRSSEAFCAEITQINLTVLPPDEIVIDTILCEGQNYLGLDIPGEYSFLDTNGDGCDSMTIIHLDIDKRNEWRGQYSLCEGTVLNVRNWMIDKAGLYTDTIYNSRGCIDSLFTIEVEVFTTDSTFIDTTICEGENYMGFATSGIFIIDTIDLTSGCIAKLILTLEVLAISHPECISATINSEQVNIVISPNPVQSILQISSSSAIRKINIFTMDGKALLEQNFDISGIDFDLDVSSLQNGMYYLSILTEKGRVNKKCVLMK